MDLSSLRLNHILKAYLIWLNCLQVLFFLFFYFSISIFCEKAWNCENFGRKSAMEWNWIITKEGFLNQHLLKVRSSCKKVFCKKGVLRNFAKFTGKHLFKSLSFNTGLSMNILCAGDKLPVQRGFFTNSVGDLLPVVGFLGQLYNFCNSVIIFSIM